MSILNDNALLTFYAEMLRSALNVKDKPLIKFCLNEIHKMNKSSTMLFYTLGLDVLINRARTILREGDDGNN